MVGNDAVCDIMAARQARLHTCYIHSKLSPVDDDQRYIKSDIMLDEPDMAKLCEYLLGEE